MRHRCPVYVGVLSIMTKVQVQLEKFRHLFMGLNGPVSGIVGGVNELGESKVTARYYLV